MGVTLSGRTAGDLTAEAKYITSSKDVVTSEQTYEEECAILEELTEMALRWGAKVDYTGTIQEGGRYSCFYSALKHQKRRVERVKAFRDTAERNLKQAEAAWAKARDDNPL